MADNSTQKVVAPGMSAEELAGVIARANEVSIEPMRKELEQIATLTKTVNEMKTAMLSSSQPSIVHDNGVAGGSTTTQKSIITYKNDSGRRSPRVQVERVGSDMADFVKRIAAMRKANQEGSLSEQKSFSLGDSASAGYLAPGEISTVIETLMYAESLFLPSTRVIPMGQMTYRFPQQVIDLAISTTAPENLYGINIRYRGEGATMTEGNKPTWRVRELNAKEAFEFFYVTDRIEMDVPGFIADLTRMMGEAAASHIDRYVISGPGGAGIPVGFMVDTTEPIKSAFRTTASKLKFEDFTKLDKALHPIFGNSRYLARKGTILDVFENSSTSPNVVLNIGDTAAVLRPRVMNGKPVVETLHVPLLGTAGDLVQIDDAALLIGMRKGFDFAMSRDFKFDTGEVALRANWYWDTMTLWKEGIVKLAATIS